MNSYLRTGLIFMAFYVLMQVIMLAVTIGAMAFLDYQISNSTGTIVSLIVGLQLTADRYARRHESAPRGMAAVIHAFTFSVGTLLASIPVLLIPGNLEEMAQVVDVSTLMVVSAVLLFVQFLIMWPTFPWFVRMALKKQAKKAQKDAVERF